ncbi:MCE family protein [Rugosimonospora africana]|uniref:ABC transporter substrate-binding protein n=1 Tax=Rugosimonospora africana TaxID=556532 RepID=A0A8J3QZ41_9ACTN|nr:MCE family protein [Rugosimonospora africana]GIH18425.1 ABC transporter substrate-binding protein [Rugosimonospora africana]
MTRATTSKLAAAAAALLLATAGGLYWAWRDAGTTRVSAEFPEAVGVYAGSDVRVLGVVVGRIDAVHPQPGQVRVDMTIHRGIRIPAGALAAVVASSVVSDRYVQLSPPYTGGARLADHAVIPISRTATPVELDQLYQSLDQLASALGPNGANANGALSDVLNTGAANLDGNGRDLGNLIAQLGAATRTLSGSEQDLVGTVDNLAQFTTMLKDNDAQVRQAEQQLSQVAGFLADDRHSLAAALDQLATALGQIADFIHDNRDRIKSNVDKLASITQILVKEKASLQEALDDIPLAVTNLLGAYDPSISTFDGRADLNELSMGGSATTSAVAAPALPLPAAGPVQTTKAGQ